MGWRAKMSRKPKTLFCPGVELNPRPLSRQFNTLVSRAQHALNRQIVNCCPAVVHLASASGHSSVSRCWSCACLADVYWVHAAQVKDWWIVCSYTELSHVVLLQSTAKRDLSMRPFIVRERTVNNSYDRVISHANDFRRSSKTDLRSLHGRELRQRFPVMAREGRGPEVTAQLAQLDYALVTSLCTWMRGFWSSYSTRKFNLMLPRDALWSSNTWRIRIFKQYLNVLK